MSGRDCEADGTDVHKVHPNTRIHSHSTHRYKFVAVGTVCGVGDDYTDPTNYKLVKLPKITHKKFIRRSGETSFNRWFRDATKSREGVQDALAKMSANPLHVVSSLEDFESALFDVHLNEDIVSKVSDFHNSRKFAQKRAILRSRQEQARSL